MYQNKYVKGGKSMFCSKKKKKPNKIAEGNQDMIDNLTLEQTLTKFAVKSTISS